MGGHAIPERDILSWDEMSGGHSVMAIGRESRSGAPLVLFLLIATFLQGSHEPRKLISDGNMFLVLRLNGTQFPGCNCGLPRHAKQNIHLQINVLVPWKAKMRE